MKDSCNSVSFYHITLSFLLLFISKFQSVFAFPTKHLCHPEQRDAILEFKNEFEILEPCFDSDTPKIESWKNNSDCCSWNGITCDVDSGDVIELNLSYSCLHGQLNLESSLFNLQFLTTLNLSYNYLSGQISSSLENLSYLTTLDLSMNDFSGQVLSSVGNLSHLTTLDLSINDFSGRILSSLDKLSHLNILDLSINNFSGKIPSSLGNLSHLTYLDLSNNDLNGHIPYALGNLSNLTTLHISNSDLSGYIPSSFANLSKLTSLRLSRNNFVGEIPSSLGGLLQLTVFKLYRNNFVGEIPSSLGNLSQLTFLDLYSNNFVGEIPSSLGDLSHLTSLILSSNKFVGRIPSSFGNLDHLESLIIDYNRLTGSFPLALLNLTKLSTLSLSNNQFTGNLPSSPFIIPSKLVKLSLGNNNFIGAIPKSFFSKLTNLEELDLSDFNTQGSIDLSIFSHLKSLKTLYLSHLNTTTTIDLNAFLSCFKSLDTLDLSGNPISVTNKSLVPYPPLALISQLYLSECGIKEFPEILRIQERMWYLDISNNNIKAQVPCWLWTLPDLIILNLSNNSFTGFERPMKHGLSINQKPVLNHLSGANNNFTGEFPYFICAMHSLMTLDLSYNKFNGSIPSCMINLRSTLRVLNLRHNNLSGGVPEDVFEGLRSLDLGHNQLVGKLPRSLIRFSSLEVFNVKNNRINDTFPFWLSFLHGLQVLILRSNEFHGPVQLSRFSKLRIIDISRNNFSGTLPSDCFVNWTAMFSHGKYENPYIGIGYYHDSIVLMNKGVDMEMPRVLKTYTGIDFSVNKFEGEIPKSIGLLKELHVLNLSNNAFTGRVTSSMGNLTALESLDVSQNKLSGEIPQELGNLSYLSYMNFSHNQFVGLVPSGTQFQRQSCSSFEDNLGLYGHSLEEVCEDIHAKTSQQSEQQEEVMSWIAAAIGFIPGVAFGFTIGYILVSYKSLKSISFLNKKSVLERKKISRRLSKSTSREIILGKKQSS